MDRAVLRLNAGLQGIGIKGDCILETWKETSSSGRTFTRAVIVEESPILPDGIYMLVVGHQSAFVRKIDGVWRLIFLPPEIIPEEGSQRVA